MKKIRLFNLLFVFLLISCSDQSQYSVEMASQIKSDVGCVDFQSQIWNRVYHVYQETGGFVTPSDLETQLENTFANEEDLSQSDVQFFIESFVSYYSYFVENSKIFIANFDTVEEQIAELARLEMGDRSTDLKKEFQDELAKKYWPVAQALKAFGTRACYDQSGQKVDQSQAPSDEDEERETEGEESSDEKKEKESSTESSDLFEQLRKNYPLPIFGAYKTLATAYQSCDVLKLNPMSDSSRSVRGIKVLSKRHPAGGRKRVIGSKSKVVGSHYYIKGMTRPSRSQCKSSKTYPMIYDFGGKPFAKPKRTSSLNFFKNWGSGTSALGTDCSGFVFAALATAGLKLSKKTPLKAFNIIGVGSRALQHPEDYGYNCLNRLHGKQEILPGDIISGSGHVVMVDEVGKDPFGLKRITRRSDCKLSNMKPSRFNFSIIQSSPSKGGIGINRFEASDYFRSSGRFNTGVRKHALAVCKARFSGQKKKVRVKEVTISRHAQTKSCKGTPIKLDSENCLKSCKL